MLFAFAQGSILSAGERILIKGDDDQMKELILSHYPIGTKLEHLLMDFPTRFIVFDASFDSKNGIFLPESEAKERGLSLPIGTQSLRIIVDKRYPKGLIPFVEELIVLFGFDQEGNLIDVQTIHSIDAA
jgi:hypothetical protein